MRPNSSIGGIATFLLIAFFATRGSAQYRILPGDADRDGCSGKEPARICIGSTGTDHCYATQSTKDYVFGLKPTAKEIGKLNGQSLTLFSAMFSGCGSGRLTDYSLLTVQSGEFVNLFPKVQLTDQSEFKVWHFPQISELPVLVTADFIWDFDARETHFAQHRYVVATYVFYKKSGRYKQELSYKTSGKFPGLDEVGEIKMLDTQRPFILAKLQAAADKRASAK